MNTLKILFFKFLFMAVLSLTMLIGTILKLLAFKNPKKFLESAAKVTYKNYQNYCAKLEAMWG